MKQVRKLTLGVSFALLATQTLTATVFADTRGSDDIYDNRQAIAGSHYWVTKDLGRQNDAQFSYGPGNIYPTEIGIGFDRSTQVLRYPAVNAVRTLICTVVDPEKPKSDTCKTVSTRTTTRYTSPVLR